MPAPTSSTSTNMFGMPISAAHDIGSMIDAGMSGGFSTYKFPEDTPKYYTTITFSQWKGGTGGGGYQGAAANGTAQATAWVTQNAPNAGANFSALVALMTPFFSSLNTTGNFSNPAQITGQMLLPLPLGLSDVHKVKWDEKPIMPWLSFVEGLIGSSVVSAAAQSATGLFGLAPNFFQTMLFDRPEYKRHEIAFKLAPRNFAESDAIRHIIWVLNNAMSPGLAGGGFLFSFPNILNVKFKPNNGFLFKFKPCVLETLAINYAGGEGHKAFYHNASQTDHPPESVEITLHLCEIEYWINGDFKIDSD